MITFARVLTAIIFLAMLVLTIWFLITGPRPVAIGTGGVGAIFGIMLVRDIMKAVREANKG